MYINFGVLRYHSKANKKFRCMKNNDIIAGLGGFGLIWLGLDAFGCVWLLDLDELAKFGWFWLCLIGFGYV